MQSPIITTKYGQVQGVAEDGCYVFKGIPYAKPPVGELRWRAPEKPEPWQGVYQADHFSCRSVQTDRDGDMPEMPMPDFENMDPENMPEFFKAMMNRDPRAYDMVNYDREFYSDAEYKTPISEDSLYLNIWMPQEKPEKPLPVAFWLHGGGFMGGTGAEVEFRSGAYAKHGVLLVTINYRLGYMGYLAHPWLTEEDPRAVGNYGILDQMLALDWVKENIAAFGGDPDNITIFGQSAGCMSVNTLLNTPEAEGKFAKAILQSGSGYPRKIQDELTFREAYPWAEAFVEALGAASLEELRSKTVKELNAAAEQANRRTMGGSFHGLLLSPVYNGVLRTAYYDDAVKNGTLSRVPMMIGSTRNDIEVTPEEAINGYSAFQASVVEWAKLLAERGYPENYVYFFVRELPGDHAGAFHSSELWYMFGTMDKCWRPWTQGDWDLSRRMVSYWTNFMKTGNPNGEGLPGWETCTQAHPFEMILDAG